MRKLRIFLLILIIIGIIALITQKIWVPKLVDYILARESASSDTDINSLGDSDEDTPAPLPVAASLQEIKNLPQDGSALGGYNVLIADRGNNRIVEVTPAKKIVWEYQFKGLPAGDGADDAFFTDGGKTVIVNLEKYHIIEQIDYQTKKVVWEYGTPGIHGSKTGYLFSPDDAYKLPNGDVIVADIKNCRVLEISPDKKIVHQYGKTRNCSSKPGYLAAPNGDTPLPNGHILISTILNHGMTELDSNWTPVFTMIFPLKYPSDPQLTQAGNILIAEYQHPGKIIEITKAGKVLWEFDGTNGVTLNKPSLAVELPNGNILSNDDLNHRVIVIDKQTKKIIWQYGVTGKPGNASGQLNIPDGVDIIMRSSASLPSPASALPSNPVLKIGQVSRNPQNYINTSVTMSGYVLAKENAYAIFSDENFGPIGPFDLPVNGPEVDILKLKHKYIIQGILRYKGLTAKNGNLYHLELTNISS